MSTLEKVSISFFGVAVLLSSSLLSAQEEAIQYQESLRVCALPPELPDVVSIFTMASAKALPI